MLFGKVENLNQQQFSNQEKLLTAIARATQELTSGKGWTEGVVDFIADLGKIVDVSRVWILQTVEVTESYIIQNYPIGWSAKKQYAQSTIPKSHMFRWQIDNPEYKTVVESRARGEWQSFAISKLSSDSWLKKVFSKQETLSMLTIPIMVEGKWWGTLGFDNCKKEVEWSTSEISLLHIASCLIANAIVQDKVAAQKQQFSILQDITESGPWELDLKSGHFWCCSDIMGESSPLKQNTNLTIHELLRLIHPKDRTPLIKSLRKHIATHSKNFRYDLRFATSCGEYIWFEIICSVKKDQHNKPIKLAGIAINIFNRKLQENSLRAKTLRDPLTKIGNRIYFEQELTRLFEYATHSTNDFALLIVDIDFFKEINDTYGHDAGDKMLLFLTAICKTKLRKADCFSRIGGEEFVILLPNASEENSMHIAESIRKTVESSTLKYNGASIGITVSIGCTSYRSTMPFSPEALLKYADHALYLAKESGRNKVISTRELNQKEGLDLLAS